MIRVQFPVFVIILVTLALVNFILLSRAGFDKGGDCANCGGAAISSGQGRFTRTNRDSNNRVKAAIVILARNNDIDGLNSTISQFEGRFNSKFNYPYVFLNDVPFNDQFKNAMRKLSGS